MSNKEKIETKVLEEGEISSESWFKKIFENASDGILLVDMDTKRFVIGNQTICKMLGFDREEIIGLGVKDIHPEEDLAYVLEIFEKLASGEAKVARDIPLKKKDGSILYSNVIGTQMKLGEKTYVMGAYRDITERLEIEDSLRDAVSRFEAIFDITPIVAIQSFDKNGVIHQWNAASEHLYGYKATEAIGNRFQDILFNPGAAQDFGQTLKEIVQTGRGTAPREWQAKTKDGEERWVYSTLFPLFDQGEVSEILCMNVDVTDRKKAEDALKESEEKFRVIFDNIIDGILLADKDTKKFFMANNTMCKMLGYKPEEVIELSVNEIHPEKDLPYVIDQFEMQARKESTLAKDIPVKRKDGSIFYADVNSTPITLFGKEYLMGVFRYLAEG